MQDRIELDLNEIIRIIYKKKLLIIGTTIAISVLTVIINLFVLKPVYEARVSIVVGQEGVMENKAYAYSSDTVTLSQKLLKTYSEIAISDKILRKTVEDLSLNYTDEEYIDFKNKIIVTSKENTQLLEISVRDNDPATAAKIANKVTDNFIEEAKEFLPQGDTKLLDKASIPKNPVKPNKTLNVIVATGITFICISTLVLLKDLKQMKIVDERDVEKYLGLRVVGLIREINNK